MTTKLLRLSEHRLSQEWLAQFRPNEDRALASQLINQIKLVSGRDFESGLESALSGLQASCGDTIAVYPVTPPNPEAVVGYHPFNGGVTAGAVKARHEGRREQHGSEGRVAHIITNLQRQHLRQNGTSSIECTPTIKHLRSQGIRHIVLVDDVSGSGKRIEDYWKQVVPRYIKRLLSLKRFELWIVLYAMTPSSRKALAKTLPNFPISTHLITVLPDASLIDQIPLEVVKLCKKYAQLIDMEGAAFGYRGSACPFIFEHGCPNNLPVILWASNKHWKGLFPNRATPTELRSYFDSEGTDRVCEALWKVNQPKLALSLLESLDGIQKLGAEQWMLLTLLGLRLRGVTESTLATKVLIDNQACRRLLVLAGEMGLYDIVNGGVTAIGREYVSRFRMRYGRKGKTEPVAYNPATYYPTQCEGKFRKPGKTIRDNSRIVPMESQ
jgi:hypothetical protein